MDLVDNISDYEYQKEQKKEEKSKQYKPNNYGELFNPMLISKFVMFFNYLII